MREGLLPSGATHLVRIVTVEASARALCDGAAECYGPEDIAASAFEIASLPAPERPATGQSENVGGNPWLVELYFARPPDVTALHALLTTLAPQLDAACLTLTELATQDWVARSHQGLPLVRAGRFEVFGAHAQGAHRANTIGLKIEAALAFGTGHHGTTRGCLMLFDALLKQFSPRRIADIGTGTGILALAAARALKIPVAAGDTDAEAVAVARENAIANGARPLVHPVCATGLRHPRFVASAPYDLIFANILAKPLRLLAPSFARATRPHGFLILSGLLERDCAGILAAYRQHGFVPRATVMQDGWVALLLQSIRRDPHAHKKCRVINLNRPRMLAV